MPAHQNSHQPARWRRRSVALAVVIIAAVVLAITWQSRSPTDAAGTPYSVTAVVDARRELRVIPRTLFGVNLENMWNANGAWNPWTQSPNAELLALTEELGASLFRFPGGTLGDFYHWRDGVGPHASRPSKQYITGEGDAQPNNFGTDEALDFAGRAGGRLMISVNAGTGDAGEAAGWVRHVAERAKNEPEQAVTWWEVGNELYHLGDDLASSISLTPEKYAARFLEFAHAMRQVDPAIRIGAIGLENHGPYRFNTYPEWNEQVLRLAGREMDFFAVHNAYAPVAVPGDADLETVYRTMLGAPELIRANLETVARQVEQFAGRDGRKLPLAVTEWGPLFHITIDHPYTLHSKTLGSALFTASMLKVFMETPQLEVANYFKLSDLNFIGLIGVREGLPIGDYLKFEAGTFRETASYHAFRLIATHFESVLVGCVAQGPTFDTEQMGWTGAAKAVPYLDMAASRDPDGRRLTVLAINRHFSRSGRATIQIQGLKPGATGRVWRLAGSGIDAHTGTGPVVLPGIEWARQAEHPTHPRFAEGGVGEITVTETPLAMQGDLLEHLFPPHSVSIIELNFAE